jgi:hypothetical protein
VVLAELPDVSDVAVTVEAILDGEEEGEGVDILMIMASRQGKIGSPAKFKNTQTLIPRVLVSSNPTMVQPCIFALFLPCFAA